MRELFRLLKQGLEREEDAVLATVIADSGSVPRGAGARMLVTRRGRVHGTIGGGAVEYRAEQLAADCLEKKRSEVKSFTLARNEVEDLGMVCGGAVNVFLQYVSAREPKNLELAAAILKAFDSGEDAWLVADLTEASAWSMGVYGRAAGLTGLTVPADSLAGLWSSRAVQLEIGGRRYYSEPLVRAGRVFVFGGGHVAQELVPVLSHLGFRCVVFEDRPEFASKELFPTAEQVVLGDFAKIDAGCTLTPVDYVVVMTRGHAHDQVVQEQVLRTELAYVGVIGSRSKRAAVAARLLEAGVSQAAIESVHTPIGLSIRAETPAEIAISIAAELIQVRAQRIGQRP